MASDNPKIMNFNKFYKWFNYQKKINKFKVKKVKLKEIKNWNVRSDKISHANNKFFKIVGIKVRSNFYKKNWDQPIILQNEVGVLGIIKNPKSKKDKARKKSYYARHNAQDSNPDKFSARYWSHKVKW